MRTSRFLHGSAIRITLVLVFILSISCGQQPPKAGGGGKSVKRYYYDCADQTVGIVPEDGTNPKAVYLCDGNTLTWIPNGHQFVVTFKKSPFVDGKTVFQNDPQNPNAPVTSSAGIYLGGLVVYHYTMTIDGKSVDDPQVVGGGGHS